MDRAAKDFFLVCFLFLLFFAVALGSGCWMTLVEFGTSFHASSGDRTLREVSFAALVILNPFGSIGWFLGVRNLVNPAVAVALFILGSAITAAIYGLLTDLMVDSPRRRNRDVKHR